ncbi:MAG: hypothetical protein H7A27_10485 [Spirochaetaceae bacterium]|nr:hypothetical protein [Spirochaetaceae bacterium]
MEDRARDEIRDDILERVFPELRYGEDPDIERYFELRASGRMLDALAVYRSRLRPRYPDDARRVVLLKLYRTRSPAYPEYLRGLMRERADDIIARLRANIDALLEPLSGVRLGKTYEVLKAVERVARMLPDDPERARQAAWAYADYARILGHRRAEADRAAYLLGQFYDQAAEDEGTDFVAASVATEERRRRERREEGEKNFFDLSKIEFDEEDARRVEIPSGLERDEDLVLAWCHKYWLRVDDPAFERIVWLYSKKYGTKHYEVFKAIKTGRNRKYQDDDILTMVATTIATRYSYTVQGDLYMQAAWRRVKAAMYGQAAPRRPAPAGTADAAERPAPKPRAAKRPVARKPETPAAARAKPAPASDKAPERPSAEAQPRLRPAAPVKPVSVPDDRRPTGSISDRIRRLSGRAYDVYRDIFLAKVRASIREELGKRRTRPGLSREAQNQAENLVYDFIERNYANAYMDWESSEHRERVAGLGFSLDGLDGIVESCYRKIGS